MAACTDELPRDETDQKSGDLEIFYRIRFRRGGQLATAISTLPGLAPQTMVMVGTEHGEEPAEIAGYSPIFRCHGEKRQAGLTIERLAEPGEIDKYQGLCEAEERALTICSSLISRHRLSMRLVRVERYFNGSKMIFYFTADSRVDFRALVKDLVQEFRTRVEMRQVGVRHETKMIGGIGTCGRELCCSSFIQNFDSVSIKMAKEQDLPLNPAKISGVCNRLLCCLTYEYETYRKKRKNMPKSGKRITIGKERFLVKRQIPLQEAVVVETSAGEERILSRQQWQSFQPVKRDGPERKRDKND